MPSICYEKESILTTAAVATYAADLPHGVTLHCRARGPAAGDAPAVLFLHGFPEAAFVWDGLLTRFAAPQHGGFRCVAPNLRGYGPSSQPADVKAYRARELVQDIAALIARESAGRPLAALVAHDWGGAVAWALANQMPQLIERLIIINSPHPGTFQRELAHNPAQQQASAYMNFLVRPDAAALLAADDFARLWPFFTNMGAGADRHGWLTETVRAQYRAVWQQGLDGGLNYYRASPLRPAHGDDPGATAVSLPASMLTVTVPTTVIWGLDDHALLPALLDGLDAWVPRLTVHRVPGASHWIVHEQPDTVAALIEQALARPV